MEQRKRALLIALAVLSVICIGMNIYMFVF